MELNIITTICVILLSLIFPRSKKISFVTFIFMWTLWGFNLWNGDYDEYSSMYYDDQTTDISSVEFGYKILNSFFSIFVPFQVYLATTSAFILLSFYYLSIKYTSYPALFSVIYFPLFILEYVFLRNFICITLIFLAIFMSLRTQKILKPIMIVLFSSTIHIYSICYLPLILGIKYKINFKKIFIVIFLMYIAISIFGKHLFEMSAYLLYKLTYYARENGNTISLTSPFHFFIVLWMDYIYRKLKNSIDGKNRNWFEMMLRVDYLSLLFIPIYYILPYGASRTLRFLVIFNIFFLLEILALKKIKKRNLLVITFCIFFLSIAYLFSIQTFDFVLYPLYKCNMLWGMDFNYQL